MNALRAYTDADGTTIFVEVDATDAPPMKVANDFGFEIYRTREGVTVHAGGHARVLEGQNWIIAVENPYARSPYTTVSTDVLALDFVGNPTSVADIHDADDEQLATFTQLAVTNNVQDASGLDAMIADDAAIFMDASQTPGVERLLVTDASGQGATIPCQVFRNVPVMDANGIVTEAIHVFIRRSEDETAGRISMAPGSDRVYVANVRGYSPTLHTVARIVSEDRGGWMVRLS